LSVCWLVAVAIGVDVGFFYSLISIVELVVPLGANTPITVDVNVDTDFLIPSIKLRYANNITYNGKNVKRFIVIFAPNTTLVTVIRL
jgi:hypothetical protein